MDFFNSEEKTIVLSFATAPKAEISQLYRAVIIRTYNAGFNQSLIFLFLNIRAGLYFIDCSVLLSATAGPSIKALF